MSATGLSNGFRSVSVARLHIQSCAVWFEHILHYRAEAVHGHPVAPSQQQQYGECYGIGKLLLAHPKIVDCAGDAMSTSATPLSSTPRTLSTNSKSSDSNAITVRGVVCFAIQVALNISLLTVTATACMVWCVPSTLLLGLAASVEATFSNRLAKRARRSIQAVSSNDGDGMQSMCIPHLNCVNRVYGLGAPAA